MAVPVYQTGTTNGRFNSTSAWTCTKPTGVNVGDLLLAVFDTNGINGTYTLAGWSTGPQEVSSTTRIYTSWRIADGTEPSSLAFVDSASRTGVAVVTRISGAHQTSPIGPFASLFSSGASPQTVGSITTTANDALILGLCDTGFSGLNCDFSSTGFSKVLDMSTINQEQIEVHTKSFPTPGALGTTSWASTSTPSRAMSVLAIYPTLPPLPPTLLRGTLNVAVASSLR